MKRLALFLIFPLVLCSLFSCHRASGAVNADPDAPVVLLFAGLDEAAENTDALMAVCFSKADDRLAVLQLPRDTYYASSLSDKLNGIYASHRYAGEDEKASLSALSSAVSAALSIPLTGSVAFKASALRAAVDALGGVRVYFPEPLTVEGKAYERGEHLLLGEDAEAFVRYREGYATGDLGRVEAQKLFLCALLRAVREKGDPAALLRMLLSMHREVITDLSLPRALSLGISLHSSLSQMQPVFFTLPGEALPCKGKWYFIPNRESAVTLLSRYFPYGGAFDPSHLFYDRTDAEQMDIYTDKNFPFTVYTEEDLSSIYIPKKQE